MTAGYDRLAPDDGEAFRAVSRAWAATVTVVTARRRDDALLGGAPRVDGFTATAFLTVSLAPPIVLVSAARDTGADALLIESDEFAVHLLASGQRELATAFARPNEQRQGIWDALDWRAEPGGLPVLAGALGVFVATVRQRTEAGDHILVLGDVTALLLGPDASPLVYHNRSYVTVGPR